jgi:hypothetical protein
MGQNSKQNASNDELSSCEADEKLSVNSFTEESLIFNVSATTTPVKGNAIPISERVKVRYSERIKEFGKGLLSNSEKKVSK